MKRRHYENLKHAPDAIPDPSKVSPRGARKKDTKRWCGGKVGREHEKVWMVPPNRIHLPWLKNDSWYELICKVCGKSFDYCWLTTTLQRELTRNGIPRRCKCGHHKGAK